MLETIIYFLKFIFYSIITLPRDIRVLYKLIRILLKSKYYDDKNYSVSDIFKKWVKKYSTKESIIFYDQIWTFQDVKIFYLFNITI